MTISQNCRDMLVWSMVNFQVCMIAGCFCAVNVIFVAVILAIILPLMAYGAWQRHRERGRHQRETKRLFEVLVEKPFNEETFTGVQECSICLDLFDSQTTRSVTPLPCSTLHVFHTDCIKKWLLTEHKCPLCKEHISYESCKRLKAEYKNSSRLSI